MAWRVALEFSGAFSAMTFANCRAASLIAAYRLASAAFGSCSSNMLSMPNQSLWVSLWVFLSMLLLLSEQAAMDLLTKGAYRTHFSRYGARTTSMRSPHHGQYRMSMTPGIGRGRYSPYTVKRPTPQ